MNKLRWSVRRCWSWCIICGTTQIITLVFFCCLRTTTAAKGLRQYVRHRSLMSTATLSHLLSHLRQVIYQDDQCLARYLELGIKAATVTVTDSLLPIRQIIPPHIAQTPCWKDNLFLKTAGAPERLQLLGPPLPSPPRPAVDDCCCLSPAQIPPPRVCEDNRVLLCTVEGGRQRRGTRSGRKGSN